MKNLSYTAFIITVLCLLASCECIINREDKEPDNQEQKLKVDTIYYVDTIYIDSLVFSEAYYMGEIGGIPSTVTRFL